MTQSLRGRTETGSLVLDSKSHTHKFHTLQRSLPQAWKLEKSHASASSTRFNSYKNSVTLQSGSISRKVLQDSPNKINSICFHIPRKHTKAAFPGEGPTPSKVSKDPTGLRITLASRLKGLPREAPRLSTICKKGQCKSFGSALCRHGLRHVDFCQARFYLKHALSSPLIYSSQATEIFPLQPKACMPPPLTEVDISNWRTPPQTHLKTPQPFLQR